MTDEKVSTLRERALAAHEQREQERRVDAERRKHEDVLRLVNAGTQRVLRVLTDDELGVVGLHEQREMADAAGIGVVKWADDYEWIVFEVEGIRLRYWAAEAGYDWRLSLVSECPTCVGDVLWDEPITNLSSLGRALARQVEEPKGPGVHRCPEEYPTWEGDITLSSAMARSDDPALILLDAVQGYIHAALDARLDSMGYRPTADGRRYDPDAEPF